MPCDGAQAFERVLEAAPDELVRLEKDWGAPLFQLCVAAPPKSVDAVPFQRHDIVMVRRSWI